MNEVAIGANTETCLSLQDLIKVAERMLSALEINGSDTLLIQYDPSEDSHNMALEMSKKAKEKGANVILQIKSRYEEAQLLSKSEEEIIASQQSSNVANPLNKEQYIDAEIAKQKSSMQSATKIAIIRRNPDSDHLPHADPKIQVYWSAKMKEIQDIRVAKPWSLTYIPTPKEAQLDGISYNEYLRIYIEACSIPNETIQQAQEYLIDTYLDKAKAIQIIAGDEKGQFHTNLTLGIDGQTFANSIAVKNIPGFEVFTGPQIDTANGVYGIPYPVDFNGKILPNLRLTFKNGVVTDYYTEALDGMQWLDAQFAIPGMRQIGEIAIGTNSALWRPSINGLYVEKGAGGVHIALGDSYKYTSYLGKPVKVDNGAKCAEHVDLSRSLVNLFGGGQIIVGDRVDVDGNGFIVNGQIIQKDGFFLDPLLSALNPPKEVRNFYQPS